MTTKPKILLVAIQNSIHTVRWIQHMQSPEWDIHLFCLGAAHPHPDITNVTLHKAGLAAVGARCKQWLKKIAYGIAPLIDCFSRKKNTSCYDPNQVVIPPLSLAWKIKNWLDALALQQTLKTLKPDVIHSLELQRAGYLVETVRRRFKGSFPCWIASNWGSDIYFFARDLAHQEKIRAILSHIDYYTCETERDVKLAHLFGLKSPAWPVFPNAGGFDLPYAESLRSPLPPSQRKIILLKGYQHEVGRALLALEAIAKAKELVAGYTILVYSPAPAVQKRLVDLTSHGIMIFPLAPMSHEQMLRLHGQARISLAVSLSDGISTSMLEAMVMGSFPIQTSTAAAEEWIMQGENGMIIPPDDSDAICNALCQALTDDTLVDQAAIHNQQIARERLDQQKITTLIHTHYRIALKEKTK